MAMNKNDESVVKITTIKKAIVIDDFMIRSYGDDYEPRDWIRLVASDNLRNHDNRIDALESKLSRLRIAIILLTVCLLFMFAIAIKGGL